MFESRQLHDYRHGLREVSYESVSIHQPGRHIQGQNYRHTRMIDLHVLVNRGMNETITFDRTADSRCLLISGSDGVDLCLGEP